MEKEHLPGLHSEHLEVLCFECVPLRVLHVDCREAVSTTLQQPEIGALPCISSNLPPWRTGQSTVIVRTFMRICYPPPIVSTASNSRDILHHPRAPIGRCFPNVADSHISDPSEVTSTVFLDL